MAACVIKGSGAWAQIVDISYDGKLPEKRQALKFQTMDVLLIEAADGQRAVVQFTESGKGRGTYRWRFRRNGSTPVLSGVGSTVEKYELIPDGPDDHHVLPLPGHDTIVRAGGIRARWSSAGEDSAYVYYHPDHAKVTVLPARSFEQGL